MRVSGGGELMWTGKTGTGMEMEKDRISKAQNEAYWVIMAERWQWQMHTNLRLIQS